MPYIEGYILAVLETDKQKYREFAKASVSLFQKVNAIRLVEGWGDVVPEGQITDFRRATKAKKGEQVLFSWIEYPDKATRETANKGLPGDPNPADTMPDPPFDCTRMSFGGFKPVVERGDGSRPGYISGYVAPALSASKQAFQKMAENMAAIALDHGALRIIDSWGEDVSDGEVTDFKRAVNAHDDEAIVFGFIEWPSKQVYQDAMPAMHEDRRMPRPEAEMPIDGKRMIFGCFDVLVDADCH